jgi:hypothetical protein
VLEHHAIAPLAIEDLPENLVFADDLVTELRLVVPDREVPGHAHPVTIAAARGFTSRP